jgi:hypothetical protein
MFMEKLEKRHIIGICGPKGVGKSFVANQLNWVLGGRVLSFADPIKGALAAIGVDFSDKEATQEPFGKSPRQMAQTLGTEWGRRLVNQNIWVDLMINRINSTGEHVIIDDVRFDNEAFALMKIGARIVTLYGDSIYSGEDKHESESGVNLAFVDWLIPNDRTYKPIQACEMIMNGIANETV